MSITRFPQQLPLELCHGTQNLKREPSCWQSRVDILSQRYQVIFDAAGNLYGTTYVSSGAGNVFELSPGAGGTWTEAVLYSFCSVSRCKDGRNPFGGLVFDTAGNLYGTSEQGGVHPREGLRRTTWLPHVPNTFQ
jgi:hypothetical protein